MDVTGSMVPTRYPDGKMEAYEAKPKEGLGCLSSPFFRSRMIKIERRNILSWHDRRSEIS